MNIPALFLAWLADHARTHPQDAELCKRMAGNVRKLMGEPSRAERR